MNWNPSGLHILEMIHWILHITYYNSFPYFPLLLQEEYSNTSDLHLGITTRTTDVHGNRARPQTWGITWVRNCPSKRMLCYWEYALGEFEDIPEEGIQVASQTSTGILMMKENKDDGIWEKAILGAEPCTQGKGSQLCHFLTGNQIHPGIHCPATEFSCPSMHSCTPLSKAFLPSWAMDNLRAWLQTCSQVPQMPICSFLSSLWGKAATWWFRPTEWIFQWKQTKILWVKWGIIAFHIQPVPGPGDQTPFGTDLLLLWEPTKRTWFCACYIHLMVNL